MDKVEVAGVLEEAARLYKDEKIEWCQGAWRETPEQTGLTKMTACAEGALMRACGFTWAQVDNFGGYVRAYAPRTEHNRRARELFLAVQYALIATPEGAEGIVQFNDGEADRTKEEVIDWFEATAKDLRNG